MHTRIVSIVLAVGLAATLVTTAHARNGQTVVLGGLMAGPAPVGQTLGNPNGGGTAQGEMGDCLDAADAQGLGPKSALMACFQLVLTPDNGSLTFPADPDSSD